MRRVIALCLLVPGLATAAPQTECLAAVARGEDVPCQVLIAAGDRAPFAGVLSNPSKMNRIKADLATLETAYDEQKALTEKARTERDTARAEGLQTANTLLDASNRLEKANNALLEAQSALEASNRDMAAAIKAMPTSTTLYITAALIAVAAFAGGYGLANALD
ncbi:MAG: hypothetical protein KC620_24415 [Myxococcales bacterium]|nr:hypothetical protein [Myxococcales bacterium]